MNRKAISARRRFEIFKRDGFTCQYCGKHPPNVVLHLDHILAVASGGDNSSGNLVTSCADCNLGKSAVPLSSIPPSLAEAAALVAEREAQIKGYAKIMRKAKERLEDDAWTVAGVYMRHFIDDSIHKSRFQSIRMFLEKLDVVTVEDAMEMAVARVPASRNLSFKYFCGICWNRIKGAA